MSSLKRADLGADVAKLDVGDELRALIAGHIESHERSLQTEIGASELGTPCTRKLGLKLVGAPTVAIQRAGEGMWRPTVGTAVHTWLADMLRKDNERYQAEADAYWQDGGSTDLDASCHPWCHTRRDLGEIEFERFHRDRWLIEARTPIGTIDGCDIPGNLDALDRWTHTLLDWKIVGPTAIKTIRREKDPGPQYRVQVQLYGRGATRSLGERVDYVAILFLPSNGELTKDTFFWEEPFDPEVGKEAMRRARELKRFIDDEGDESIFRKLKTVDDHCSHCPFFSPGSNDPHECPGDPSLTAELDKGFKDLLPKGLPGS